MDQTGLIVTDTQSRTVDLVTDCRPTLEEVEAFVKACRKAGMEGSYGVDVSSMGFHYKLSMTSSVETTLD
ncbi:hypothetical protein SEA_BRUTONGASTER_81 [Gordonia phage BrutonGaster]|uniref:Uncharacterized protein n=1 Tax=Gordonia phage BrutonGaster TaxID=2530116 RepID=A0A482JLN5_9CAUD|nr:hypothetical protein HOV26_gp101 [Gordonia phage BrutonGaster]QBP33297.1 hypothetical protein SEA_BRUTONGASTER_81 [Gordonia phage BrutonGaster]